jgi:hypothetical protein
VAELRTGLEAASSAGPAAADAPGDVAASVAALFRARYPEMVRLADLLGANAPADAYGALPW